MNEEVKDSFELALDEKMEILQGCQSQKGVNSCFVCEKLLECDTRKDYVLAVYNSMSKGKSDGGFDF